MKKNIMSAIQSWLYKATKAPEQTSSTKTQDVLDRSDAVLLYARRELDKYDREISLMRVARNEKRVRRIGNAGHGQR